MKCEEIIAEELLKIKAVFLNTEEPFTWASGIKSPIYCDNRLIISFVETRNIIENAFVDLIREKHPDVNVVVGTSTAGIPHAAFIAEKMSLPMAYVRSKVKDHGRNKHIEGLIKPNSKVVVIEDLFSTGKSSIEVVNILRSSGFDVLGVISIFTYNLDSCHKNFSEAKCRYYSLSNFDVLIEKALHSGYINETSQRKLKAFRNNPQDPSWTEIK